jgi:hypothetical protein
MPRFDSFDMFRKMRARDFVPREGQDEFLHPTYNAGKWFWIVAAVVVLAGVLALFIVTT